MSAFMSAGIAIRFQSGCVFCNAALAAAMSTTQRSSRTSPGNVRPPRSNVPTLNGVSAAPETRPTDRAASAATEMASTRIASTPLDRQSGRGRDLDAVLQLRARPDRLGALTVRDAVERVLVDREPL